MCCIYCYEIGENASKELQYIKDLMGHSWYGTNDHKHFLLLKVTLRKHNFGAAHNNEYGYNTSHHVKKSMKDGNTSTIFKTCPIKIKCRPLCSILWSWCRGERDRNNRVGSKMWGYISLWLVLEVRHYKLLNNSKVIQGLCGGSLPTVCSQIVSITIRFPPINHMLKRSPLSTLNPKLGPTTYG